MMTESYSKLSNNVIQGGKVLFTRIDAENSLGRRLVQEAEYGVWFNQEKVANQDGTYFEAVRITFAPCEGVGNQYVDLLLSDFGNYISEVY